MKGVLLALLSFACALTGAAQSPPAQFASRTALIIGISSYSKPEISSLPGVAADRLMAEGKGLPGKPGCSIGSMPRRSGRLRRRGNRQSKARCGIHETPSLKG